MLPEPYSCRTVSIQFNKARSFQDHGNVVSRLPVLIQNSASRLGPAVRVEPQAASGPAPPMGEPGRWVFAVSWIRWWSGLVSTGVS